MWSESETDGRQRVGETSLMPLMVKAIQELSTQVEELKKNSHKPKGLKDMDGYDELMAEIKNLKGE